MIRLEKDCLERDKDIKASGYYLRLLVLREQDSNLQPCG